MTASKIFTADLETPYGTMILGSYREKLCLCDWKYRKMRMQVDQRIIKGLQADLKPAETPVIELAKQQLNEYFNGERTVFDIPLHLVGTAFQQSVWNALLEIPYGSTETYLGLSRLLGNEKAIRAVASANGANAVSIIVPCHRIIGSQEELTGYAGGLKAKQALLEHEDPRRKRQMSLFRD